MQMNSIKSMRNGLIHLFLIALENESYDHGDIDIVLLQVTIE